MGAEPRTVPYEHDLYHPVEVYDTEFSGAGGDPIRAWYLKPAGARARAAGREVEIMLAARAAPACRAAQLALSYLGGGVGAGTTWPRC